MVQQSEARLTSSAGNMDGGSLDDAFASFLGEIGDVGDGANTASDLCEADSDPPPAKRAKLDLDSAARTKRAEALRKAAYVGDARRVERLLDSLSTVDRLLVVDDVDEDDGFTALHLCAIRGHIDVARVLLQRRADVDAMSLKGDTPLMWAAHRGDAALCGELCRAGADLTLKNCFEKTAALQARLAGHRRLQEALEKEDVDGELGVLAALGAPRDVTSKLDAAAEARRAANAAMVADAIQAQREREEEEAFWKVIRERREARETSEKSAAPGSSKEAERNDLSGGRRSATPGAYAAAEVSAAAWDALPTKMRPHYKALGALPDASEADVRKLYRKLALQHHPDKNRDDPVGAKERFTVVALAYEALCEYLATRAKPPPGREFASVPPPSGL